MFGFRKKSKVPEALAPERWVITVRYLCPGEADVRENRIVIEGRDEALKCRNSLIDTGSYRSDTEYLCINSWSQLIVKRMWMEKLN